MLDPALNGGDILLAAIALSIILTNALYETGARQ